MPIGLWDPAMNESKPDYGAMNSQELRQHLEGYDFVTPTGEPLAPFLDSVMGENLDRKTVASICEDIEAKQFACLRGPLRNHGAWIELGRRVKRGIT
jgi:hypothetical protein